MKWKWSTVFFFHFHSLKLLWAQFICISRTIKGEVKKIFGYPHNLKSRRSEGTIIICIFLLQRFTERFWIEIIIIITISINTTLTIIIGPIIIISYLFSVRYKKVSLQFIFFFPFHISLYFDSILLKILALVKRFNASKRPEVFA